MFAFSVIRILFRLQFFAYSFKVVNLFSITCDFIQSVMKNKSINFNFEIGLFCLKNYFLRNFYEWSSKFSAILKRLSICLWSRFLSSTLSQKKFWMYRSKNEFSLFYSPYHSVAIGRAKWWVVKSKAEFFWLFEKLRRKKIWYINSLSSLVYTWKSD